MSRSWAGNILVEGPLLEVTAISFLSAGIRFEFGLPARCCNWTVTQ
jgi:hypothetical protein